MSSNTKQADSAGSYLLGGMTVTPSLGRIDGASGQIRIEPKMMELLNCLSSAPGTVISREQIEAKLWGKDFIADDAVARLVSKLRKALGDQATSPRFIETIPKRGYRLIAPVEAVSRPAEMPGKIFRHPILKFGLIASAVLMLASILIVVSGEDQSKELATYYYKRFTPDGASQSETLFRRSIEQNPSNFSARVGLANALVQTVLLVDDVKQSGLTASWRNQRHLVPGNHEVLEEALWHAETAITLRPHDAEATKAKAMALSALGRMDEAANAYAETIRLDPLHWGAMLNLAEIHFLQGDTARQIELFEKAFTIMQRTHADDHDIMARWGAPVAAHVAYYHLNKGNDQRAMALFQSALEYRPLYEEASKGLALAQKSKDQPKQ